METHVRNNAMAFVLLITLAVPSSLRGQQPDQARPLVPSVTGSLSKTIAPILIIDYTLVFPQFEIQTASARPTPALLSAIATWLAENFDLPASQEEPQVELVPPAQIAAIRYRGFAQGQTADDRATLDSASDTVAVYDDVTQTIYLPAGWRGTSPAELSILVHEMVHHLQSRGQLKYECPQAREKVAYAAQERWLGLFGQTLASEFHIDPFTLLVRASCLG